MPKRIDPEPQLGLLPKTPRRLETSVEYDRAPPALREPTVRREPPAEPPWWRRAREATQAPTPLAPPSLSNAWRGLLREEAWTVDLPSGQLAMLEELVRTFVVRPGVVEASVGGGRERPHFVQLKLAPFPPTDWARLARPLAERTSEAELESELADERIPMALLEACDAAGLSLLPRRLALVAGACTCGGARLPCDHVLATHLVLARRLGKEPLALVALRGAPKDELLAMVGRVRAELSKSADATQAAKIDPFAAPAPLEVDWNALAKAPASRKPLPPIQGWRPSETFDALCRRLLEAARGR